MNAGCTIVSPNYLPYARVLARSYLDSHPDHTFFVLLVANARVKDSFEADEPFSVVLLDELGIQDLNRVMFQYDILEANTNVKPTFIKYLLSTFSPDTVTYLDPDIYIYSPLTPIHAELQAANVVLTPHITQPIHFDGLPDERTFLSSGIFNLGFVAVRSSDETLRFLNWWESRCLSQGFSEVTTGLFVDQKWMNLAPCLFSGVSICKDVGCNVAYWNLHERTLSQSGDLYLVNKTNTLRFFHFSGIVLQDTTVVSKYTARWTFEARHDLIEIFAVYRDRVNRSKRDELDAAPYGYDRFSDGKPVGPLLRRIYSRVSERFEGNPFDATGGFYLTASTNRLLSNSTANAKLTWKDSRNPDKRIAYVNRLLRIALRILGPDRYTLLLKYLQYISNLRNQSFLISR